MEEKCPEKTVFSMEKPTTEGQGRTWEQHEDQNHCFIHLNILFSNVLLVNSVLNFTKIMPTYNYLINI